MPSIGYDTPSKAAWHLFNERMSLRAAMDEAERIRGSLPPTQYSFWSEVISILRNAMVKAGQKSEASGL